MPQLHARVGELSRREDHRREPDADGVFAVPWQVYEVDDRGLAVHWYTNAFNELIGVDVEETAELVRVTIRERSTSSKLPGQRRSHRVQPTRPLGDRRIIDGATGRVRTRFVPDVEAAWAVFDEAVAEVVLGVAHERVLARSAEMAIEDGCEGTALRALREGRGSFVGVYRERGLEPPDVRVAAKRLADAALARTRAVDPAAWETIGWTLVRLVEAGRLGADHEAQLAPLIELFRRWVRRLDDPEDTGEGTEVEAGRFDAACKALLDAGGLHP